MKSVKKWQIWISEHSLVKKYRFTLLKKNQLFHELIQMVFKKKDNYHFF